jgi:RNA polymerase sigma-70 factor, ECF subfamily
MPEPPGPDRADQLTALFRAHHATVLAYAARRLGADAAADVAAETFAVAWRRLADVPRDAALPWLLGTARNLVLAARRTAARRGERESLAAALDAPFAAPTPDLAGAAAERDLLRRALGRLAEPDREVLLLVAWDGLSPAEAARVLGCRPNAARVRLLRSRRRLTAILTELDTEAGEPAPATDPTTNPTTNPTAPTSAGGIR